MTPKSEREYRNMRLEVRALEDDQTPEEEAMIVTGYATTFDEPYTLFEDGDVVVREEVAPEAFKDTDMSDVIMQYDHTGRVFARIKNKTLDVMPDAHGLYISADLGGTELGRQLFEEIRGGYTDKMSFGFTVSADEWKISKTEDGKEEHLRRILGVGKLYDVSAVSIPANDATEISVRHLTDGVIERVQAERLEAERLELLRRRAEIRARALKGADK